MPIEIRDGDFSQEPLIYTDGIIYPNELVELMIEVARKMSETLTIETEDPNREIEGKTRVRVIPIPGFETLGLGYFWDAVNALKTDSAND